MAPKRYVSTDLDFSGSQSVAGPDGGPGFMPSPENQYHDKGHRSSWTWDDIFGLQEINNYVYTFTVHDNELYAGGDFTTAGGNISE